MTSLVKTSISVSGNTSWQDASGTITLTGYKKIMVVCGVHGALQNSAIIDVSVLQALTSSTAYYTSAYWTESNLGMISLYGNHYNVSAKTNTIDFDYAIYGIN